MVRVGFIQIGEGGGGRVWGLCPVFTVIIIFIVVIVVVVVGFGGSGG